MCEICDDLGILGFCTEYSDLLCYINSNYNIAEILPTLLTTYKYLAPETRVFDVFMSKVDVFPTAVDNEKECSRRHEIKPATLEHFGFNPRTRDKLTSSCLKCKREYDQDRHLKKAYGKSREEFLTILKNQNNKCASCGRPINMHTKRGHHNKETGQFYDLLCNGCNSLVGYGNHDYRIILKCLLYQASIDGIKVETLIDLLKG